QPVRLEFIGDTIESLRAYDPATQRSVHAIDQLTVIPLRDVLGDDRSATLFDYLAQVKESSVVVAERDEVDTHASKLLETVQRSYEEAAARDAAMPYSPPAALFASWNDVKSRLAHATDLAQIAVEEG